MAFEVCSKIYFTIQYGGNCGTSDLSKLKSRNKPMDFGHHYRLPDTLALLHLLPMMFLCRSVFAMSMLNPMQLYLPVAFVREAYEKQTF